ncbi:hypothetical protein D3C85_1415520 [compost metagenome]
MPLSFKFTSVITKKASGCFSEEKKSSDAKCPANCALVPSSVTSKITIEVVSIVNLPPLSLLLFNTSSPDLIAMVPLCAPVTLRPIQLISL